ncbi:MAG: ADP-ribosylglycohydrolase family protein [Chthoniobacteraceae bacterium]
MKSTSSLHPLPAAELVARIHGCWMGKAIGGTLGTPHEGKPGPLSLSFYDPKPEGILPNDDLDLQLVWLHHLCETGALSVSTADLAQAWQRHVDFPFDEYAICLRNAAYGLSDHRLGAFDNWFGECMGAAIRSELWACIAPGQPERAAGFAWTDAACDHAGDGIRAEIFFAALQSLAFVERNPDRLLDSALSFLPSSSRIWQATQNTRKWWKQKGDWLAVRNLVAEAYGSDNFTDVTANLAYTTLGWLAGNGDFGTSLCIATNCGADTDCTAATLGALLGILAPGSIPAKWKAPIGNKITLSPQIMGINTPPTLNTLTMLTLGLGKQLADDAPAIGEILPRRPASAEDSPVRIPVQYGWSDEQALSRKPEAPTDVPLLYEEELPGHWIRRSHADFSASVMVLKSRFFLPEDLLVRVCAWSQTETALWIDGIKPENAPADWTCSFCKLSAPSFHRGSRGIFEPGRLLSKGWHELLLTWDRPQIGTEADLVLGVSKATNKQWLPQALWVPEAVAAARN